MQKALTQPGPGVFPGGRVAMLIDGSYNMERFKNADFGWDVALVPKGPQERVIYGGPDSLQGARSPFGYLMLP